MAAYPVLTPVNVLTGFLGRGKTRLLQRSLASPQLTAVAVLVNEWGEIGLDHHLLQNVAESTLPLENACVCCAIRGDLQQTLGDLLSKRTRSDISNFGRVGIETSGLADPAPIACTLLHEPVIGHHYRLSTICATVGARNGMGQLERFAEAMKQAALADRLILTKTDPANADRVKVLAAHLPRLNPSALLLGSAQLDVDSGRLLIDDIYDADGRPREVARWLAADAAGAGDAAVQGLARTHDIHSFSLTFEPPLDWSAFGIWSTMLLRRDGGDVLRIKALRNVAGVSTPVLINGVQHLVHPPSRLDARRRPALTFGLRRVGTLSVANRALACGVHLAGQSTAGGYGVSGAAASADPGRRPAWGPAGTKGAYHVVQQVEQGRQNDEQDNGQQLLAECRIDNGAAMDEVFAQHFNGLKGRSGAENHCDQDGGLKGVEHQVVDIEFDNVAEDFGAKRLPVSNRIGNHPHQRGEPKHYIAEVNQRNMCNQERLKRPVEIQEDEQNKYRHQSDRKSVLAPPAIPRHVVLPRPKIRSPSQTVEHSATMSKNQWLELRTSAKPRVDQPGTS